MARPGWLTSTDIARRSLTATPAITDLSSAARLVTAALALGLLGVQALAQSSDDGAAAVERCDAEETLSLRGLTVRFENDLFAGTDSNYTNGVAVMAVSRDLPANLRTECLPTPVRLYAQLIALVNPGYFSDAANVARSQNVVAKFGQSMYTPVDSQRTDLIADDRPYAGLLYTGMAWNRRSHATQSDVETLDTRELTLGVIGSWSLAEQTQNLVHDAIGSDRFLGWDHQLKNEPALQMAMARKFKRYRGDGAITPGVSADLIPAIGMRLGNIQTAIGMSVEGRIGWNIPNDFGTYPIQPGAENRPPSAASTRGNSNEASRSATAPRAGVHLFGTLEGKYVAHDFSLDGNLFRSSHYVTRRPWVVQAAVGLSTQGVLGGRGYRLAVMRVYRSQEFEEQTSSRAYGSVALSVEF